MKRIRKWINRQRLSVKIWFVLSVAMLVLLLGYTSVWKVVFDSYNKMIYEKNAQVAVVYSQQINNKIDDSKKLTLSIIGDNGIQENLLAYQDAEFLGKINLKQQLNKLLKSHVYSTDDFLNFGIYMSESEYVGEPVNLSKDEVGVLIQKALDRKGVMDLEVYKNRVFVIRQIRDIWMLNHLGVIIAELDVAGIIKNNGKMFQRTGIRMDASVYVNDICIYCGNEKIDILENDGWSIKDEYFVTQCSTDNGWTYLIYSSYKEIMKNINKITIISIVMIILIAIGINLACRYVINHMMRHFGILVQYFNKYAQGMEPPKEEMKIYKSRNDEIGYLFSQFERMVQEHKLLEEENYNRMLLNQEAQYRQLQSQIHPHFIFNTLSLISWMAYQHKDTEIAELTNALAKLIRSNMKSKDDLSEVCQEMELVENYMYIQYARYGERIDFSVNIPGEMQKVKIPRMTFQPLVENSITYALEDMLEKCVIRISGYVKENDAVFIVEDNGEGIEEDIIEKLISGEKQAKGNGIGLVNVHKRIQMMYSDKYGLSFGRNNEMTQVYVKVPYRVEGEKEKNV